MKYVLSRKVCASLLIIAAPHLFAQSYQSPLNIPSALSSNFGELRNNHFHSGIDYKTQNAVNKPVSAIADGYVSRISVSPSGYGLALYVTHPSTGHTSVYGHLNSFAKPIAVYVKQKQYELESFRVDLTIAPGEIAVKKGEQIALSGNTGSSGGPHLHFEIRDTETEDPIDPLTIFRRSVTDTQGPDIRGIAIYPKAGSGVVGGSPAPVRIAISKSKEGAPLPLKQTISAWGKIGAGVKAYDRMNGQNNVYGVKTVRLFVDGKQIFESTVNRFPFTKTRMLNSFVDFEEWRNEKSFYMRSFVEPGNTLPVYRNVQNDGYIDIDEERPYKFLYELEDAHGNVSSYSFVVQGKPAAIPPAPECTRFMAWNLPNAIVDIDFVLHIPPGNLYANVCAGYEKTASSRFFSNVYTITHSPVPLQNHANLWIRLNADNLDPARRYGVVRIDKRGNESWIGGTYKNGGIEFQLNELGSRYAIDIDSIAPKITPVEPEKWLPQKRIRLRLTDDKSGIAEFRGEINGKFVLFTHDVKSNVYTYVFDDERLTAGRQELIFKVSDGAGNSSQYHRQFVR